jgi:hypothetical protein
MLEHASDSRMLDLLVALGLFDTRISESGARKMAAGIGS